MTHLTTGGTILSTAWWIHQTPITSVRQFVQLYSIDLGRCQAQLNTRAGLKCQGECAMAVIYIWYYQTSMTLSHMWKMHTVVKEKPQCSGERINYDISLQPVTMVVSGITAAKTAAMAFWKPHRAWTPTKYLSLKKHWVSKLHQKINALNFFGEIWHVSWACTRSP